MWGSGSFSLFLQADPVSQTDGSTTLFTSGATASGWFGGIPLYTYSDASGNTLTGGFPLFVGGATPASSARTMPLWLGGAYPTAGGSVELTLWNAQSGVRDELTLFVQGSGVTAGATPFNHNMGLFLRRAPVGAITLHVGSPGYPVSSGTPLYLYGQVPNSGVVTLAIPNVVGSPSGFVQLYINGF